MLGRDYPAETLQVGDAEKAKIALYDALIHLDEIERELSAILQGRRVDMVTPKFLNPRIRDEVLDSAEPLYVAA